MFLVDLNADGVRRKKLNKQVWMPSDLTRLQFNDVFAPDSHLLGPQGRGLQQVLTVFTRSRVPIAALTLGSDSQVSYGRMGGIVGGRNAGCPKISDIP